MKNRHPNLYRILLALCLTAFALSGCRSVEDSSGTSVATIKVTPSNTTMETGDVLQLSAEKLYTDSSTVDCSDSASWTSSDTAVASFSSTSNGLLSAIAAGTTTISVSCSGKSKSYTMTVTGAASLQSIEISPVTISIAEGTKQIVIATGVYSDGSTVDLTDQVSWSSSDTSVLAIERSNGSNSIQATAPSGATGSADVTASYGSVSGSMTIYAKNAVASASLSVNPPVLVLAPDARIYLKAETLMSDDMVQDVTDWAIWSSDATAAATVSTVDNGLTEGVAAGAANIEADNGTHTNTAVVSVGSATLSAIEIYPSSLTMDVGTSETFTAIGIYSDNTTIDLTHLVTWSSSDTDLLTVTSSHRHNPRVTTLDEGTAYLSVSLLGSSIGANAVITVDNKTLSSIEITPAAPDYPANLDIDFKATGIFSDGSRQDLTNSVKWSSSDTDTVKINNALHIKGKARTWASGTATVTASLGSTSGTSSVTVNSATLSTIEVTPAAADIPEGYVKSFKATGLYNDNSTFDLTEFVSWKSSSTSLVMDNFNNRYGNAWAVTGGTSGITVTASFKGMNGQDATVAGTVSTETTSATLSSIEISPTNPICMIGYDIEFTATGVFSDSTTMDITKFVVWKTSDNSVARAVNASGFQGIFECNASGSVTVTAATGSSGSGTTTLYVADQ